ncbi:MAG: glycosyltransferase family 2 protein [Candidatus Methanomethylicia archaeon]
MNNEEITIIIPTLNEAEGIMLVIKEIRECLEDPHILVIDAKSNDGTPQIAARLNAQVVIQEDRGKGRAIAQSIRYINPKTKYVVIIDGDYTYPAYYIPKMIKLLEKNTEIGMVTGDRFSKHHNFSKHPPTDLHHFGNCLLKLMHRLLNKVKMRDPLTGFRVIRYHYFKDFKPKAKGFDIEVELNYYINKKTKIIELPIEYRPRVGLKKLRIRDGFIIFMRIFAMMLEDLIKLPGRE